MSEYPIISSTVTLPTKDSREPLLRIHYLECKPHSEPSDKVLVLVHGFPETSHQFHRVMPEFAKAGYRVIAPDYRGAGRSSKPLSGNYPGQNFTKIIMAEDIYRLVHDVLGIQTKIHLVGHDIGGMVVFAYATQHPEHLASLVWGECPLPGSSQYHQNKGSTELFHFVFHSLPDLPESLVEGKEKIYLDHFYWKLGHNQAAYDQAVLDEYVRAYSQPGALRCGFDVYRAFEQDAKENEKWRQKNGKLKVPSMCLKGEESFLKGYAPSMIAEFFEDCKFETVSHAGHWVAMENPTGFVEAVSTFITQY